MVSPIRLEEPFECRKKAGKLSVRVKGLGLISTRWTITHARHQQDVQNEPWMSAEFSREFD
jgi:hypothetical protein